MSKLKSLGIYAINIIAFIASLWVTHYVPSDWQVWLCFSIILYSVSMLAMKNKIAAPLVVTFICTLFMVLEFIDFWKYDSFNSNSYMFLLLKYESFIALTGVILGWLLYCLFLKKIGYSVILSIIVFIMLYIFHWHSFFRLLPLP
jgi:hypothetical protein